MVEKQSLPSIDDELGSRPKLKLPRMAPRSAMEDEEVNANAADLARSWPAVSTRRPDDLEPASLAKPETIFDSVRFNIPAYLNRRLSLDAVERDCTKTHLVLQALAQAGYEIDPADMAPDRRGGKK